eukprot:UN32155
MWAKCHDDIRGMRLQCGKMWDLYITGVPILYMQTAVFATYSYFFCILIGQAQFVPGSKSGQVNYYVPVWSMICFVLYAGWLKLSLRLIDPFGRTVNDDISW